MRRPPHRRPRLRSVLAVAAAALAVAACDTGDGTTLRPPPSTLPGPCGTDASLFSDADGIFALRSPDFTIDGAIPRRYGDLGGGSQWPDLVWSLPPGDTVELALVLRDDQSDEVLWIVTGIDPDADCIPEGELPAGAVQQVNSLGEATYSPPDLAVADPARPYVFTLHALGDPFALPTAGGGDGNEDDDAPVSTEVVLGEIDARTIAQTLLVGTSATVEEDEG